MANDELADVAWLATCTNRERSAIRRRSDIVEIPAGRVLLRQGDSARWFYAVLSGSATVSIDGRVVGRMSAGDAINELEVIQNEASPATVIADSDLRVLVMGRREFLGMLDEIPGLARRLLMPHIPTAPAPSGGRRRPALVPVPAA